MYEVHTTVFAVYGPPSVSELYEPSAVAQLTTASVIPSVL